MSAPAEQNLLFGLLAQQNGLIDQAQLVAALEAWIRDKDRPLAEYLIARGEIEANDRTAIETLVASNLKKHAGSAQKSLAAIPAGAVTWKCLAQASAGEKDLETTVAYLSSAATRNRDVSESEADPEPSTNYSVGAPTSDGERFRIIRPHACGGLGAVFVALDTELHREVALKQILDAHADDPVCRQRFLLEAEVTGGLEHPGIVPVYGLGTHASGRPYYAMRFIRGDSLKEAIDAFHARPAGSRDLELRKLLRRFVDVCNAIDYAHGRGVLHRDLKPSNIILGRYGETLVVDWGLAKTTGRSDPGSDEQTLRASVTSGSAETLPGSALGSPAYMSPEQADGQLDRLGPPSDVYSLGGTLYCILTGAPPFAGTVAEVFQNVRRGTFRPPRAVDASIDAPLEAICLKAMSLKREDRYPTCRAFAEDVERWMADEPVTAWREPLPRRARRWARRNRPLVTGAAVAVLAALVGTAAVLAAETRANGKLTKANSELAVANLKVQQSNADLEAANARERQRFDLALEAIKLFHGDVSEDLLLKQKPFEALRKKLLSGAAEFYGKLEALLQGRTDPASRRAVGNAYEQLGELTAKIGDKAEALAVHKKALAVRRALATLPDAAPEAKLDVAESLMATGLLQMDTGDSAGALAAYEEARALAERSQAPEPGARALSVLSRAHLLIGGVDSATGKPAEALAEYAEAVKLRGQAVAADPDNAQLQAELALSHNAAASVLLATGRAAEALASYETVRSVRRSLVASNPEKAELKRNLAVSHFNIGLTLASIGRPAEALADYEKAREIWRALVDAQPTVTEFQSDLADAHYAVGHTLGSLSRESDALEAMDRARAIWQALVAANPKVTEFQNRLANALTAIGGIKEELGKLEEATLLFEQARSIYRELADANPHVTEFQRTLAFALLRLGMISARTGRVVAAGKYYEEARGIQQSLFDANPAVVGFQSELAITVVAIGRLRQSQGRLPEAAAAFRQGTSLLEHITMMRALDLYNLGCFHSLLVGLAGRSGEGISAAEGQAQADRAMQWLRKAAESGYGDLASWQADTDLDSLRSRRDFQLLLLDVAMPRKPFAGAR